MGPPFGWGLLLAGATLLAAVVGLLALAAEHRARFPGRRDRVVAMVAAAAAVAVLPVPAWFVLWLAAGLSCGL